MSRTRTLARGVISAGLIAGAGVAGFALGAHQAAPPHATLAPQPERPTRTAAHSHSPSPVNGTRHPGADTLPNIAFRDRHGRLRRFAHWQGHPLLVNFWAPWCSPCRAETPLLERLSRARPQGVQVIGVGVGSRSAVLRYARRGGIRYPLLIGLGPGMRAIHDLGMVVAFPLSVFVDTRGRIVKVQVGRLHAAQAKLILNRIGALDQGRIDLATARREISAGMARLAAHGAHVASSRPNSAQS